MEDLVTALRLLGGAGAVANAERAVRRRRTAEAQIHQICDQFSARYKHPDTEKYHRNPLRKESH